MSHHAYRLFVSLIYLQSENTSAKGNIENSNLLKAYLCDNSDYLEGLRIILSHGNTPPLGLDF
jgi:hypothetical protein